MSAAAGWQDLDLEREVLADAIFRDRTVDYLAHVTRADFGDEHNGRIFQALAGVSAEGNRPDYPTVRGWLADHGQLDTLTDAAIGDVLRGGVTLDVGRSCERLRLLAGRRVIRETMRRGLHDLDEDPRAADSGFAEHFSGRLLDAAAAGDTVKLRRPLVSASDAIDQWVSQPAISDRVLPLGVIPAIDQHMRGGIEPGECLFNLARPGSLKTMLMLNILRGWLARTTDTFFVLVELEMPKRQLIERFARMFFELNSEALDHRRQSGVLDVDAFKAALDGLYVVDDVGLTLPDIEQRVRLAQRQMSNKVLGGVIVDHCGLIRAGQGASAYDRATETAIGIKQLARRVEAPVIAIVQANRTAAQSSRDGAPPEMEQARDSGAYEENADFMLSMSAIQMIGTTEYVTVKLVKNRRGRPWISQVGFNPQTLRMAELFDDGRMGHVA